MTPRLCWLLMALASLVLSTANDSLPKAHVHVLTFAYISSGSRRLISLGFFNPCNPQKSFKVILISVAELACIPAVIFCESL